MAKMLAVAVALVMVCVGVNMALTTAVVYLAKDTSVGDTGIMTTTAGALVEIGQQRTVLPLSSMLYLPRVYRSQLEHLTVKLQESAAPDRTSPPA